LGKTSKKSGEFVGGFNGISQFEIGEYMRVLNWGRRPALRAVRVALYSAARVLLKQAVRSK